MQHASGKDYDPSAWAKERQERIKRALQARQQRQSGSPDKNHTFKPQLLGGTSGVSSKLPAGARVGDASATRGAYDLTVLEGMDGAFPPKRTSNNIYRDIRYDTGTPNDSGGRGDRNKRPEGMGGASDSLDRLAVSTTDRRRLSRAGSTSSHGSATASPWPLPCTSAPYHDSNGYMSDMHETRRQEDSEVEADGERATEREVGGPPGRSRDGAVERRAGQPREVKNGSWNGPRDDGDNDDCGRTNSNPPAESSRDEQLERRSAPSAVTATKIMTAAAGSATRDALSQEVEQRPHVRGSLSEERQHHRRHRQRDADRGDHDDYDGYDNDERDRQPRTVGSGNGTHDGGGTGAGAAMVNERERWADGAGQIGRAEGELDDVSKNSERRRLNAQDPWTAKTEDADFFASLRGRGHDAREAATDATRRGGTTNATTVTVGGPQMGRARHARRPEWNSDTAEVASLGGEGGQASILTDNSPAAVQARVEMSTRRRSSNDVIAESPYAAGGGAFGNIKANGITNTGYNTTNRANSNSSWKHKHTKTLPWDKNGLEDATGGFALTARGVDGNGDRNGGDGGDGDAGRGREVFDGRPSVANQSARERAAEGRGSGVGGVEREGYRRQLMPSPSTGKLTAAAAATAIYRAHGVGDGRDGDGGAAAAGVPAEKDQLRQNLSLLKKKMHGQAGSRRSQSAGPRAGDPFGEPGYVSQGGPGNVEPRHGGGRQHLHMTTGTAPANPGSFLRDRDTMAGRPEQSGRRGGGVNRGDSRGRSSPDGPGSPYVVDLTSREAAAGAAARSGAYPRENQQHTYQPQHLQRPEQRQTRADKTIHNGRTSSGMLSRAADNGSGGGTTSSAAAADVAARKSRGGADVIRGVLREAVPERTRRRVAAGGTMGRSHGGHGDGIGRNCFGAGRAEGSPRSLDRRRAWEGGQDDRDAYGGSGGTGRGEGTRSSGGVGDQSGGGRGGKGGISGGAGRGGRGGYADDLPPDAFPEKQVELKQCGTCTRRFTREALEKHSRACSKVFQAKRKVFNAAEMRIKGTELEKFAKTKGRFGGGGSRTGGRGARGQGGKSAPPPRGFDDTPVGGGGGGGAKSSKWRQQSKQFRDALRQARVVTEAQKGGKSLADLPPPKPSAPDPSLIPCPHCGRRFNELAGERHIQHCKNIKAKPSVLKKGSGSLLGHAARKTSSGASGGGKSQRW